MVQINVSNGQGITQAIKAKVQADGGTISNNTLSVWQNVMSEVKTAQANGSQIYTGGDDVEKLNDISSWQTDFKVKAGQVIELAQDVWNRIVQLLTGTALETSTQNDDAQNNLVNQQNTVQRKVDSDENNANVVDQQSDVQEQIASDVVTVVGSQQTLSKAEADNLVQQTIGKSLPEGVEVSFVMSNGTIIPSFKRDGQPISANELKEPTQVVVQANPPKTPLVTGPPRGENSQYDAIVNPEPVEPVIEGERITNMDEVLLSLAGITEVAHGETGIIITRADGQTLEIGNTQAELERAKAFISGNEVAVVSPVKVVQGHLTPEQLEEFLASDTTYQGYSAKLEQIDSRMTEIETLYKMPRVRDQFEDKPEFGTDDMFATFNIIGKPESDEYTKLGIGYKLLKRNLEEYKTVMQDWTDGPCGENSFYRINSMEFTNLERVTLADGRRAWKTDQGTFLPASNGMPGGTKVEE